MNIYECVQNETFYETLFLAVVQPGEWQSQWNWKVVKTVLVSLTEHVSGSERKIFRPSLSSIYGIESLSPLRSRSDNSRFAHAPLDFFNPVHRSAPLIWLSNPLRFNLLRSTARPDLRGCEWQGHCSPQQQIEGLPLHPLFFFISRSVILNFLQAYR